MTQVPDRPPPAAEPAQRTDSTRRLRLLAPLAAISTLAAIGCASQLLLLDADPDQPQFRGMAEANRVLPWVFAFAGVLWLASFVPGLEVATRVRVLRACCWVLGGSAVAWIAWVLLRHAMAVT